MTVRCQVFRQKGKNLKTFYMVQRIGESLLKYLKAPSVQKKIARKNKPGKPSKHVQDVLLKKLKKLGFQSEMEGLFQEIPTKNLRPDYYRKVQKTGIIIEVERGRTKANNMDMLDLWKCHICERANHLFLLVPNELKHNTKKKKGYDCFEAIKKRMAPFFIKGNYTNVHSLWLFGY